MSSCCSLRYGLPGSTLVNDTWVPFWTFRVPVEVTDVTLRLTSGQYPRGPGRYLRRAVLGIQSPSEIAQPDARAKRAAFLGRMRRIDPDRLVFVDGSGINIAMGRSHASPSRGGAPIDWTNRRTLVQSPSATPLKLERSYQVRYEFVLPYREGFGARGG